MLAFTREFLRLRRATPALRRGTAAVRSAPVGVLAFERSLDGVRVLCLFELAGESAEFAHPDLAAATPLTLFGGAALDGERLRLPPYAFALIRL